MEPFHPWTQSSAAHPSTTLGGASWATSISIPDEKCLTWRAKRSVSLTTVLISTQLCKTDHFQKGSSSLVPHCGKTKTLCFQGVGHLGVGEAESRQDPHATTRASCCLPAPSLLAPPKRQSGNVLVAELARKRCFLQEKHFLVSLFSLSGLTIFFFEGGGELSWRISLKVYITGEKNIHFLSNRKNFLDADKYHCPEG